MYRCKYKLTFYEMKYTTAEIEKNWRDENTREKEVACSLVLSRLKPWFMQLKLP